MHFQCSFAISFIRLTASGSGVIIRFKKKDYPCFGCSEKYPELLWN